MHGHYLLLIGNCDVKRRERVIDLITRWAADWFNYTTDAWLLCLPQFGEHLRNDLYSLFGQSPAYFLLANVGGVTIADGVLPEEAWAWLRRHHLMANLPQI